MIGRVPTEVVTCSWIVTPGQSRFGDSECVCWGSWGRSGALTLPRFECGQMDGLRLVPWCAGETCALPSSGPRAKRLPSG